jgi:hypothetical protein
MMPMFNPHALAGAEGERSGQDRAVRLRHGFFSSLALLAAFAPLDFVGRIRARASSWRIWNRAAGVRTARLDLRGERVTGRKFLGGASGLLSIGLASGADGSLSASCASPR